MGKTFLLVHLRVKDLTAETAEETIRKRIDGGEKLRKLERAELWEFRHSREGGEFRSELERLVRRSNLFVHPNKHAYRIVDDYRSGWEEEGFLLWVRGKEGVEGMVARETLRTRFGLEGLEEVRYGVLWVIRPAGIAGEDALAWARKIGITTGPRDGLLVHPHYQEYDLDRTIPPRKEGTR